MNNQPNILLITSEDNGPHFGCYGDMNVQTPHLDTLAAEGTRFGNAYVTQAVCSPGRASILTGLYPHQNGQIGLATHNFSMFEKYPTMPTLLKKAGYRTGRIGKLHVLPESAFDFDWVWNPPQHISFNHRDVKTTAKVASTFINKNDEGDKPFFLMVNYADAHLPWIDQDHGLPEKPLTGDEVQVLPGMVIDSPRLRHHTANYYNCISRLDMGIGMLLEELKQTGQADHTLVIYITDHGPQFSRGKGCIYELGLRAPLIVRWPKVLQSIAVCNELVSQIDILPTVLQAAGVTAPENLPGQSLLALMKNKQAGNWRTHLFAQWNTSHPYPLPGLAFPQRSVRDDRYKLIHNLLPKHLSPVEQYYTQQQLVQTGASQEEIDMAPPMVRSAYARWRRPPEWELYDLQNDPWEFDNLADDSLYAGISDALRAVLGQWQKETADALADPQKLAQFMAEQQRAAELAGKHKQSDFKWNYLNYLS